MASANGSLLTNSHKLTLRLNPASPELSSGLSSYRHTFESTVRPIFNNPDLSDADFLNSFHNILLFWLAYEHHIFTADSCSIFDILKARGYLLTSSTK